MQETPEEPEAAEPARPVRERVWPSLLIALALVILDGWYFVPGPGLFVCLVLAIAGLVIAATRAIGSRRRARPALLKGAIYGVAVLCIVGLLHWQGEQSRETATEVIMAVNAFQADTGLWPDTLSELVPHYLAEIPPVNFRHENRFRYESNESDAALAWYIFMPTAYWQHNFASGETVIHD